MAVSQLFPGPTAASALTATQRFRHAAPNQMTPAAPIDRHGLPQTMTAARITQLGPPEIISVADADVPEPGELEVLVRVSAAGVGPWDALVRAGKSGLPIPPPLTLGAEISGVVERLGPNTTGFAPAMRCSARPIRCSSTATPNMPSPRRG